MTEDELYEVLLRTGAAGDATRYNGQPSMIERIALRQAQAIHTAPDAVRSTAQAVVDWYWAHGTKNEEAARLVHNLYEALRPLPSPQGEQPT